MNKNYKECMKKFFDRLKWNTSGVVLLETVLVLPLFMLLIGGMCYFGDLLLADSRVRQGGVAFGYLAFWGSNWDAFKAALSRFQPEGTINSRAFYTDDKSIITQTSWGALLSSYATLKNMKVSEGIIGMMLMGEGVYNQASPISDSTLSEINLGTILDDDKNIWQRHWLVSRMGELPYGRLPMSSVASTWTIADEEQSFTYYAAAEGFVEGAMRASIENWMAMPLNEANEAVQAAQAAKKPSTTFYHRKFGSFFSSEDE
jgi:hypothetical protein